MAVQWKDWHETFLNTPIYHGRGSDGFDKFFAYYGFPHVITFPYNRVLDMKGDVAGEPLKWLARHNLEGRWAYMTGGAERFYFTDGDTALMFKMRW